MSTLCSHLRWIFRVPISRHSRRSVAPLFFSQVLLRPSRPPKPRLSSTHFPHHPWHRVAPRASPSATRLPKKTTSKRLEAQAVAEEAGMVAVAGPAGAIPSLLDIFLLAQGAEPQQVGLAPRQQPGRPKPPLPLPLRQPTVPPPSTAASAEPSPRHRSLPPRCPRPPAEPSSPLMPSALSAATRRKPASAMMTEGALSAWALAGPQRQLPGTFQGGPRSGSSARLSLSRARGISSPP